MSLRRSSLVLLLATCLALPVSAQTATLTTAAPEDVGMSSEALAKIGPTMQRFIDSGRTAGIMTLVAKDGEIVHWDAYGWRVLDEDELEPTDIFRIYSMTKPVTSVAAMMLVEEGELSLDDEVAKHIPAFADVQVYDDGALRAPSEPMTVRHLIMHTSGLTYGIFGNTPVDRMYVERLDGLDVYAGRDLEEAANVIASIPLVADPGARWTYSVSTDVLGRVVEVASGMTLDDFFQERIFAPLGMDETGFHIADAERSRLAGVYEAGEKGPVESPTEVDGSPPDWLSGGGGLLSTADDYLRFAQMLLNEGELDGVRLLEAGTVRDMRRNHLPEEQLPIAPYWPDTGFGLGFAVSMTRNAGNYWWLGVANTYFWIDPDDDLIVFAWTQANPVFSAPLDRLISPIVYEALNGN